LPVRERLPGHSLRVDVVSSLRSKNPTLASPLRLMSAHGKYWSLPVWTSGGHDPQSRFAGDCDGSSLTRVGPIQVTRRPWT
jgi:hypothetical protein